MSKTIAISELKQKLASKEDCIAFADSIGKYFYK